MLQKIKCPTCNGGELKIEVPKGFVVITDGAISKMPFKKICKNCNRAIKYIVVKEEDYEKTLVWLHEN